jgi:type III restriction enzyme
VAAWAKNDHLGFEVQYVHSGVVRKYRPDFLVRLAGGDMLVLQTKGRDTEQDRVKRRYLEEWAAAVTAHGGFGHWRAAMARRPGEIRDLLGQRPGSSQGTVRRAALNENNRSYQRPLSARQVFL